MEEKTVVASALIRNTEGLVLVFEDQHGFAALPGGTSQDGETAEETAVRESLEETGLGINVEKLLVAYNLIVFNKDGTERCRFRHYLLLASTKDSNPRPLSEWKDSGAKCIWITLEDLKHYKAVWPLPDKVRTKISESVLVLGDMGELEYRME